MWMHCYFKTNCITKHCLVLHLILKQKWEEKLLASSLSLLFEYLHCSAAKALWLPHHFVVPGMALDMLLVKTLSRFCWKMFNSSANTKAKLRAKIISSAGSSQKRGPILEIETDHSLKLEVSQHFAHFELLKRCCSELKIWLSFGVIFGHHPQSYSCTAPSSIRRHTIKREILWAICKPFINGLQVRSFLVNALKLNSKQKILSTEQ